VTSIPRKSVPNHMREIQLCKYRSRSVSVSDVKCPVDTGQKV